MAAGFPGVEDDGGILHARLWSSSVEFTASPVGSAWVLAIQWPVRATEAQLADWCNKHPHVPMDIHLGETRLSMTVQNGQVENLIGQLHHWAAVAEEAIAACILWRRAQRAPGEGM